MFVSCFYCTQEKQTVMNHMNVFLIYLYNHRQYSWSVVLADLFAIQIFVLSFPKD